MKSSPPGGWVNPIVSPRPTISQVTDSKNICKYKTELSELNPNLKISDGDGLIGKNPCRNATVLL